MGACLSLAGGAFPHPHTHTHTHTLREKANSCIIIHSLLHQMLKFTCVIFPIDFDAFLFANSSAPRVPRKHPRKCSGNVDLFVRGTGGGSIQLKQEARRKAKTSTTSWTGDGARWRVRWSAPERDGGDGNEGDEGVKQRQHHNRFARRAQDGGAGVRAEPRGRRGLSAGA